jgi:hypothetical protein
MQMVAEVSFDFDLAFGDIRNRQDRILEMMRKPEPLRRDFGSAAVTDGSSPFLLALTGAFPAAGRLWEITDIGVFAGDGHSAPVSFGSQTVSAQGNATSPGAGAGLGAIAAASLPAGSYQVYVYFNIAGTVTQGTDNQNIKIELGGATQFFLQNDIVAGPQVFGPFTIKTNGSQTLGVNVINAGTTGSIYSAQIAATPLAASSVIADIYAGPTSGMESPGDMSSFIASGAIPFTELIGDHKAYANPGDRIYAWVYNCPAGVNLQIAGTLLDWRIEDRTEMSI